MVKRMILLCAMVLLLAPGMAAAIPCQDAGDVALLTTGCDAGAHHFDDFLVTYAGPVGVTATVFLTDVVDLTLGFDVVTVPTSFVGALDVAFSYRVTADDIPIEATPEPATLLLVGTTLAGLGLWWRRRTA